jgi:L-threonylcarbamoyladenylate synthase
MGGHPPARSALQVRNRFGNNLDCIINGPLGDLATPTLIRDAASGAVIRR